MKLTLAALAGFATWSVLWVLGNTVLMKLFPDAFREDGTTDRPGFLLVVLGLSLAYSVFSGFLTAWIGGGMAPAYVAAGLVLAVGIAVQWHYGKQSPLWYHLLFLGLLVPAILLGAKLRLR